MNAAQQKLTVGRIVGGQAESGKKAVVGTWNPPDEAAVDALPPLTLPLSKPRSAPGRAAAETSTAPLALPDGIAADSTHAYLFHHAKEAAAVVRTIIGKEEASRDEGPLSDMTPQQLVAAILIGLGEEIGAQVCRHLDGDATQVVARAITEMPEVGHELAITAVEMVRQKLLAGDYDDRGGPSYARGLLMKALGPYRANHFVERALYPTESGFSMLNRAEADQIAPFISNEHPQTIALILSQLDSHKSAGVLAQFPEPLQADVSYRMATTENIPQRVIAEVEEALEVSLEDLLVRDEDIGGPKVVADMLNMTGSSVERTVLNQMDAQAPEVAEAVRNQMFTFADICKMNDREIQTLLRELEESDLTIALKPAGTELQEKFFSNMSERARASVQEVMEGLEQMLRRDVEEVQLRIVHAARQLEEQGKIRIVRGDTGDDYV